MANSTKAHRPPVLAILLLILLSLVLLVFITARQITSAENRRLRLLAGFSERVEAAVPDLADRLASAVERASPGSAPSFQEYIEAIPHLDLADEDQAKANEDRTAILDELKAGPAELRLKPSGQNIYLTYSRKPGQAQEATPKLTTRFELGPMVESMIVPGVFDMVAITDLEGQVLFAQGEPELRLAKLEALVKAVDAEVDLATLGSAANVVEIKLSEREHTILADRNYTVFFQPVRLELPALDGEPLEPIDWIACGVVSTDRMLSATLNSSPFLFLALLFFFPMAVVSWPFLKLWLITPRQRFSRFDVAGLLFSSFLGLSLLPLLIFGTLFAARMKLGVDEQLENLARNIEQEFRHEVLDAYRQMIQLDANPDLITKLREATPDNRNRLRIRKALEDLEGSKKLETPLHYPHFHSIFWATKAGDETAKLPLRETSVLTSNIGHRQYFQCALEDVKENVIFDSEHLEAYFDPPEEESLGNARKHLKDEVFRTYGEGTSGKEPPPLKICLEFVLSNTTGQDLGIMARASQTVPESQTAQGEPVAGLPVVAMVTRFISLTEPVLGDGFSYALVDSDGSVLVHSDERRSLTENFVKASDQDPVLSSVLESRRGGTLNINYLGRPHRIRTQALTGMPWSLVVLRDVSDLRFRVLELGYDFFNAWVIYLLVLALLFAVPGFLFWDRALDRRLSILWPSFTCNQAYGRIVLTTSFLLAFFALALATKSHLLILLASWGLPVLSLGLAGYWLHRNRSRAETIERQGRKPTESEFAFWPQPPEGDPRRDWSSRGKWILLVVLVLLALFSIMLELPNGRPTLSVILLVALSLLVYQFLVFHSLPYFQKRLRLRPYRTAFSCLLFCVSTLPSFGFIHLASSRQTQFLIQDHQTHLASALESKERHLEAYREDRGLLSENFQENPWTESERTSEKFLGSFYQTGVSDSREEQSSSLLARLSAREWPQGGLSDENRWLSSVATLLAFRPVPLNGLAPGSGGVDLSRFEPGGTSWTRQGRRLHLEYRESWGAGDVTHLASALTPKRWLPERLPDLLGLVLAGLFAVLACFAPAGIAWLIAEKILLIRLAITERSRETLQVLLHRLRKDKQAEDKEWQKKFGEEGAKTFDDEVMKTFNAVVQGPEPVEAPDPSSELGSLYLRLLLVTSVPSLALDLLADARDVKKLSLEELIALVERQGKREALLVSKSTQLIVIHEFQPEFHDSEKAMQQIRAIRSVVQTERRVVILTRNDPRLSRDRTQREDERSPAALQEGEIRREWGACLAPFTLRYGHDGGYPGHDYRWELTKSWVREGRLSLDGVNVKTPTRSVSRKQFDRVFEECRPTRRLQEIGLLVFSELDETLSSGEQIMKKISHMAFPYYHAIWANCDTDEKVVLAQLAEEGVVNPKSSYPVNDLIQRKLIVRNPELRLMNESFRQFVRRTVLRTQLLYWEQEQGTSAWSVLKWLMPVPLLLLGGFLFVTQKDAFSTSLGFVLAVSSIMPTLLNVYGFFEQITAQRQRSPDANGS